MKCPSCNAEIPDKAIAAHIGGKGGAKSLGKLTPAQRKKKASDAAKARWADPAARQKKRKSK